MSAYLMREGQDAMSKVMSKISEIDAIEMDEFEIVDEQATVEKSVVPKQKISFGTMRGMIKIQDDFDEPLDCLEDYT